MENFSLVVIPLFVAFDAIGLVPIFWSLSQGVGIAKRRRAIHNAIFVAWLVGPAFVLVSDLTFTALGIQISDLMIAGGLILFVLALNDLLHPEKSANPSIEELGVVPLGVPLIVGPAVLTTLILLSKRHGFAITWIAFNINILFTWLVLVSADSIGRWMGREGAKVVSKVFSLVLAAFAVMLVRKGLIDLISGAFSR